MQLYGKIINMNFIIDITMGRLVKWLRIAGFDTVFYNSTAPDKLIEIASKERRIILTKNGSFIKKHKKALEKKGIVYLLLTADSIEKQLKDVASHFKLNLKEKPFSLCINCNKPLVPVSKEEAAGKVPEYVYQNYREFVRCKTCGKIFWGGTHKERMEERLNIAFK